jgi:hypothetical protein
VAGLVVVIGEPELTVEQRLTGSTPCPASVLCPTRIESLVSSGLVSFGLVSSGLVSFVLVSFGSALPAWRLLVLQVRGVLPPGSTSAARCEGQLVEVEPVASLQPCSERHARLRGSPAAELGPAPPAEPEPERKTSLPQTAIQLLSGPKVRVSSWFDYRHWSNCP